LNYIPPARNKSDYIFRFNYKIIVNLIALNIIWDYHIIGMYIGRTQKYVINQQKIDELLINAINKKKYI
jgi:hypothetical protein